MHSIYGNLNTSALILELESRGYVVTKKDPNVPPKKSIRPPPPKPWNRVKSSIQCKCHHCLCPVCNSAT